MDLVLPGYSLPPASPQNPHRLPWEAASWSLSLDCPSELYLACNPRQRTDQSLGVLTFCVEVPGKIPGIWVLLACLGPSDNLLYLASVMWSSSVQLPVQLALPLLPPTLLGMLNLTFYYVTP